MEREYDNYRIYPNVFFGDQVILEDFIIVGELPRGKTIGELCTSIGSNAIIRSHTVIYAGNTIGDNFQTGHGVLIRESNKIGNNVSIGSHSIIEHDVVIEDEVRIHSNSFIPEYSTLELGCWIGPGVIFTNARYPRSRNVKITLQGPTIRRGAIIGAGAVLLPGVVVGQNSLVGAGAVVVSDVPDGVVIAGNPAKIIKSRADIKDYQ